jgi:cell division septal protein FtsQ
LEQAVDQKQGEKPSAEWLRQRRMRSIAIALMLLGMIALFYAATIVRLGSNVLNRAM